MKALVSIVGCGCDFGSKRTFNKDDIFGLPYGGVYDRIFVLSYFA